ncbi:MAG: M20 family metallopeptidase [Clostridiales bacterium]|nr:M20 family metallopeptidase [Clostridiales bacterium]
MNHPLLQEALDMNEELVANRRALHQIPELGTSLPATVAFVTGKLKEMGIEYQVYEDCSCVVATIGQGGKCFMLRSDMDALPVEEETGLPFASQNGCMHACGHDLHATILLGAARLLKGHESELKGTVKLFFQSGEEIFAGSKAAIEEGLLENPKVDAAFAMHVGGAQKYGTLVYGTYTMSSVYGFRIQLTGKGTHGSMPELGVDPINTGVHVYLALQELLAREVSAQEEATLTIGHFEAGKANNVIPNTAVLEGTLRTFKAELREFLIRRIHEVVEGVCKTYRTEFEIEVLSDVPATVCDDACTQECLESVHEVDSEMETLHAFHTMGSEDFAFISERVPATFFFVGAGVEDESLWCGQHNPHILFHEGVLARGAAIYAKTAMDWLNKHA